MSAGPREMESAGPRPLYTWAPLLLKSRARGPVVRLSLDSSFRFVILTYQYLIT